MLARYLPPAAPTLRSAPRCGEQWLHEVKFDGWRIQLHKHGGSAAAFTKNVDGSRPGAVVQRGTLPFGYEHINMLGRYAFSLPDRIARGELRPLRIPSQLDEAA
jgi:hypothetical protein